MKEKILVVNQYYWPSFAATAQLVIDLCEHLAREGHEVTVICSQSKYSHQEQKLKRIETRNGVKIIRLPSSSFGRQMNVGRLFNYISYGLFLVPTILGLKKFDLMISLSTPPMVASAVLMSAHLKKSRFLYWCQDIYPDIATVLGVIKKDSFLTRSLEQVNQKILSSADLVVTPSVRMSERLKSKAECAAVCVPNWSVVASDETVNDLLRAELPKSLGLKEGELVLMYSGNMGRAHDFSALYACWSQKAPQQPVHFKFIGDGAKKKEVHEAAKEGIKNGWRISFSSYLPREQVGVALSLADIQLLAIDQRADGLVFPSKLYGILQAGKPTWLLGSPVSEIGEWIELNQTGLCFEPGQGKRLKEMIMKALHEPEWCGTQAAHSSLIYDKNHERKISLKRFENVIGSIL